jgi:hypothetical protein
MASSSHSSHDQKKHAYLYAHVKKVSHYNRSYDHAALPMYNDSHAMFASSSTYAYGRNRPRRNHVVSHAPRRNCNSPFWGLVLKYYELRTRQHKILNVNSLRPSKHYFP